MIGKERGEGCCEKSVRGESRAKTRTARKGFDSAFFGSVVVSAFASPSGGGAGCPPGPLAGGVYLLCTSCIAVSGRLANALTNRQTSIFVSSWEECAA